MSVSSGMIRLPKATKTPLKSKVVPRQSLATIVKDLGKNTSCDIIIIQFLGALWIESTELLLTSKSVPCMATASAI